MKKIIGIITAVALAFSLAACGSEKNVGIEAAEDGTVTLKGIVDLTPHSELIEFVRPQLEEQGIYIDLVATLADTTTNERLSVGEIDFNFFQHLPYLEEYNETNGDNLVSAGEIHVEPIAAYSDKYGSLDEVPDNASIVVPNNVTNEYRALRILEIEGFIRLRSDLTELKANVSDIEEYIKPVNIVEVEDTQVIGFAPDFDIYIINTNKAIEAGIDTTKYLFRESSDSPYANIIAVRAEDKDNPAVQALVKALKSDETKKFIEDNYNGAVIPAE